MAREDQNLVLGRGRVYVDPYDENGNTTGEIYIGNTPAFSTTGDEDTLEHVSSDEGLREVDEEVTLSRTESMSLTTDDIQPFNMALFFKGTSMEFAQVAIPTVVEHLIVTPGRWYQLGTSAQHPSGHRMITITTVTDNAGTPVAIPVGNYEVDTDLARIFIKGDAADVEAGDEIIVTYAVQASSRTVVLGTDDEKLCAVRFIAANAHGKNTDHYWPKVRLTPDGDYELKGDDWQQIGLTGRIMKKGNLARHYIDGRATAA